MPPPVDPPFRLEHIGSLVRPAVLLEARDQHAKGDIDDAALREVENTEIEKIVAWQVEQGFRVITDGEFRRDTYTDSFGLAAFEGLQRRTISDENFRYTNHSGEQADMHAVFVEGKLEWTKPVNVADFEFLKSITPDGCIPKVTLPGPCHIHYRAGRDKISQEIYPDLDVFWSDVMEAWSQEIAALHTAGCRYIQFDETSIAKFGDPKIKQGLADRGDDWRQLLELYTDVINQVIARAPKDMALGLHLCRGNKGGHWQAEGGYDDIATHLFRKLAVQFYFLEYDSPRAGSFAPLAEVPEDKTVVLGLVSTKVKKLEEVDYIKRRVAEAAQYVSMDRLCISPQCGFSGSVEGTGLDENDQQAKTQLLKGLAQDLWGYKPLQV